LTRPERRIPPTQDLAEAVDNTRLTDKGLPG
jgi:hypothetical protein